MKLITVEKERKRYARFYKPKRKDRETEARDIAKSKGARFPKDGSLPKPGTVGRRLYNNAMRQLQRYTTEGKEKRTPRLDDQELIEIIDGLRLSDIVIVDFQLCGTFVCSEDTRTRCVILHPSYLGRRLAQAVVRNILLSDDIEDQAGTLIAGSEIRSSCEIEEPESVMVVKNEN